MKNLERIMSSDPEAEFSFVFVTIKGAVLDLSVVPMAWVNRLQWYHASVDIHIRASDTQYYDSDDY